MFSITQIPQQPEEILSAEGQGKESHIIDYFKLQDIVQTKKINFAGGPPSWVKPAYYDLLQATQNLLQRTLRPAIPESEATQKIQDFALECLTIARNRYLRNDGKLAVKDNSSARGGTMLQPGSAVSQADAMDVDDPEGSVPSASRQGGSGLKRQIHHSPPPPSEDDDPEENALGQQDGPLNKRPRQRSISPKVDEQTLPGTTVQYGPLAGISSKYLDNEDVLSVAFQPPIIIPRVGNAPAPRRRAAAQKTTSASRPPIRLRSSHINEARPHIRFHYTYYTDHLIQDGTDKDTDA
ncbi:hypothetical protein QCA50_012559 [Cerrena zonata]|uniref:Uncharacterized protein n=1 Tax=Cerrena zonata TaxID=2478898 RepID=A0AAW0G5D2_9APHY